MSHRPTSSFARHTLALALILGGCQDYEISNAPTPEELEVLPTLPATPAATEVPPVDTDAPTAQCSASTFIVAPNLDAVDLDGSGSTDPQGLDLTYEWSLADKPTGSDAAPSPANAQMSRLEPDLAGIYQVQLIVTNSAGDSSAPCTMDIQSIAAEDLRVEMYWDKTGEDMDLHLLDDGGTPNSLTDCYYVNCTDGDVLDWGQPGFAGDNPRLDLDDIPGDGPENINIDLPANNRTFTVMVHDHPTSPSDSATNVTVNIYINGALAHSDTRSITGENSEEYFATIDWPSGNVTAL